MAVINPSRVDGQFSSTITWAAVTTADTGAAIDIADLEDINTIQVTSAGAGTAQMRRSNDGTNFVNWGTPLAVGITDQAATATRRLDIGAVATATVTVTLCANRRRP